MRRVYILLFLIFPVLTVSIFATMTEVPLGQRILNSQMIIEGKVLSVNSEWNQAKDMIYTYYEIDIYKVLKGNPSDRKVIFKVPGGRVGNNMITSCPVFDNQEGDYGIFFLSQTYGGPGNGIIYEPYSFSQGVILFNLINNTASDPFHVYKDIKSELYDPINQLVKFTPLTIKSNQTAINKSTNKDKILVASISSFSPTSTTAGTGDSITINGREFGTNTGIVRFKNADDGGNSFINAPSNAILLWNDTMIRVRVPSKAGTGQIQIQTSIGDVATSGSNLTLNYAVLNSNDYYRTYLVNMTNGGYKFEFSDALFYNQSAVNSFLRALQTWRCATYVNFSIATIPTTATCRSRDGINLLSFSASSCPLTAGILALTLSYWSSCGGGVTWYLEETDLTINSSYEWNYGPGDTQAGQYDLESVVLHELGHSHQLAHTNGTNDAMYYMMPAADERRSLVSTSDEAGGDNISSLSSASGRCGMNAMTQLNSGNCELTLYPIANFSATPTIGCSQSVVQFSDQSTNNPTNWFWDINNDGINEYSGVRNPQHAYIQPGQYSVRLIVANQFGLDTIVKTNFIRIFEPPTASITGSDRVCRGTNHAYAANASQGVSNVWSVTGGTVVGQTTGNFLIVSWLNLGSGRVTLIQTVDSTGCKDTISIDVRINALPSVTITGIGEVCTESIYTYNSNSATGVTKQWSVTNGSILGSSSDNSVNVRWGTPGVGKIKVIATVDTSGCQDTSEIEVVINSKPNAAISGNLIACAKNKEIYSAPSMPNMEYLWSVAGGEIQGARNTNKVEVIWSSQQLGSISLIMRNSQTSCRDSITEQVTINPLPIPVIKGDTVVCNHAIRKYSSAESSGYSISWAVVGGKIIGSDIGPSVDVEWDASNWGTLKMYQERNSSGCLDSSVRLIEVTPAPLADIIGMNLVCKNSVTSYYTSKVQQGSYSWKANGGVITKGSNADTVYVRWLYTGPGILELIKTSTKTSCADSNSFTVQVEEKITPKIEGTLTACQESIESYSSEFNEGYNYHWYVTGGTVQGKNDQPEVSVRWGNGQSGNLKLVKSMISGTCSDSSTIDISLSTAPDISLESFPELCTADDDIILTQGKPDGGTYSGKGVTGNSFSPSVAGEGVHIIRYTISEQNSCTVYREGELKVKPSPDKPSISYDNKVLNSDANMGNQWFLNGSIINGANERSYSPFESGFYKVQVTGLNGCKSYFSDEIEVIINDVEDLSSVPPVNWSVYPVPAENEINLSLSGQYIGSFEVTLYNFIGQEVFVKTLVKSGSTENYNIDLSEIEDSALMLRILIDGRVYSSKIIISR